ncbi:MAG: DUF935 family protein [Mangrovibacterium sp.]
MAIKDFFLSRKISVTPEQVLTESPVDRTPVAAAQKISGADLAIINKIVGEAIDRSRKKIKQWRDAMTAAEDIDDPRWYLIQDLYDDTIDAHLSSVIDTRKMTTTNHRFYVTDKKNGDTLDEQTSFLDKNWFFEFIDEVLEAINKEYTLAQVLKGTEYPVVSFVPRRNVCPQRKRVYTEVSGSNFIDYSTETDVIEIKHNSRFGILNDVMPNLIWKKNAMQAWAEFSERFGMPLISATTANVQDVPRIEAMLKKMGEAAQAVLPNGTTIEVHDTANAGNTKAVYEAQAKFHDDQVSKRFLGGTMLTDNGSSRSQSEVHERTLDDKISIADKRFVRFIVNDKLFPVLQSLGYPFDPEKHDFIFDETEELSLTEHWKIVSEAVDKFEFDDKGVDWIAKTFNIPITALKKPVAQNTDGNFKAATTMRAMAVACGVNLPDYHDGHKHPAAAGVSKSLIDDLNAFDEQLAKFLYNDQITEAERQRLLKGKRMAEELRASLFDGWGDNRVKVAWNAPDNRALAAMEMNLFKFSEAKSQAEALMLNRLLINKEKMQIRSERDFIEQARKINAQFNETYLAIERDFAIAVGQNSARYMEFIGEKNIIGTWEYQTVGDDEVRPEHAALDGRVFKFDDVTARQLWPPNGYRCRCEGVQFVGKPGDKLMSGNDAVNVIFPTTKLKDQFAINRAEAGVVFRENQMYLGVLKDLEGKKGIGKETNDYSFKDYGLKPFSELKGKLKPLMLDKTITPTNVGELFTNNAGNADRAAMGFLDYLKRKLILTEKVFRLHTSGKYVTPQELRHQLFPTVINVLTNPSEVYLRDGKRQQVRYIKFYQDKTIVVDATITNDAYEIETWYEQKVDESRLRTGLLIK